MRFTKMHGIGNDYIYVYGEVPKNASEIAVKLSDRHYGVGADGVIFISFSEDADFKMRMFNADGSEGRMCGNGIRCVGKYVFDKGYTDKTALTIKTLSGIRKLQLTIKDDKVASVAVDMGKVLTDEAGELIILGETMRYIRVDVGNPHAVIFTEDVEIVPVTVLGPMIENNDAFSERVNVEFVQPVGENALRMRVWERGSGVTLACGTGACAAAAASVAAGLCNGNEPISVELDGGRLEIEIKPDGTVIMSGPAEFVFEGEIKDI